MFGLTFWTLTKLLEKNLEGNYTKMQRTVLKKKWKQPRNITVAIRPRRSLLKAIQIRRKSHCRYCRTLQVSPHIRCSTRTHTSLDWPANTFIHQVCGDTGCLIETSQWRWLINTGGKSYMNPFHPLDLVIMIKIIKYIYICVCVSVCVCML